MTRQDLIRRGLTFYWRTHLAVALGVATAVAVLAGALLVGDSVRGSLRQLVLDRLGRTDQVVASATFFRDALADDIAADAADGATVTAIAPMVMARGLVTDQASGRRAGQVAVYGVDERFWRFHGMDERTGPTARDALLSPALADQLQSEDGGSVLVRLQRPTDVPIESLHGRKDDPGRTLRLTVAGVLPRASLGEFSLEPQQGEVRAVFVPLSRLQEELEAPGRVNTLLVSTAAGAGGAGVTALERLVTAHATLGDLGLTITPVEDRHVLVLGSDAGLVDDAHAGAARDAAEAAGMQARPVLTYLANTMRVGDREVPYSLVTALDLSTLGIDERGATAGPVQDGASGESAARAPAPIVLNAWAARDLQARTGDRLALEYFFWQEPGRLVTREATFRVAGVVPISAGDRDLAPSYPGITDSPTLDDWDPPFPVDLRRVRPVDEAYWEEHRTTPKAYIPIEAGQRLWRTRYGALTSLRIAPPGDVPLDRAQQTFEARLRASLDPLETGLAVRDVRASGLAASTGATDFGEYFVYFSFFLVVAALLLAALFFKLGVEQRAREVGLLRAVGFGPADVRRLFLAEGLVLSVVGSALGALGALGYAWVLMLGLRTWWVDAVGTTALTLHVTPVSLIAGVLGGVLSAAVCIWWTLRSLNRISERSLLAGTIAMEIDGEDGPGGAPLRTGDGASLPGERVSGRRRRPRVVTIGLAVIGAALLVAGAAGAIDPAGAFFGGSFALLAAALGSCLLLLRRRPRHALEPHGWRSLAQLGFRNASHRPARSVLSMAIIAAATFILISVDAFRRDGHASSDDPHSGLGGYALVVDTVLPVAHDPNTGEGRDALNLFTLEEGTTFEPFRVRPGEDASCLNLYAPRDPRIVAPRDEFRAEGRFAFAASLADTEVERANPWLLLEEAQPDGAVPVIADANSMTYVLHRSVGDEMTISSNGEAVTLRFVAALRDSIFQSELLMSEAHFLRLFPEQEGYQFFLVQTGPASAGAVIGEIEDGLADFGADATTTADRLAQFHRVENTYLSTFQTLGGLGLLLGTVGLAAVLLRNVLERRRELALLGAVGYRRVHVLVIVVSENVLLLAGGLLAGAGCAALAVLPAAAERGGRLPLSSGGLLLVFAVFLAGLLSSLVATRAATRAPLLSSLRSE